MDYAMIGKIEKAKRYAEERHRIKFHNFHVSIEGENGTHTVHYEDGVFDCDCSFFQSRGYCSHSMAMERILDQMVEKSTVEA